MTQYLSPVCSMIPFSMQQQCSSCTAPVGREKKMCPRLGSKHQSAAVILNIGQCVSDNPLLRSLCSLRLA